MHLWEWSRSEPHEQIGLCFTAVLFIQFWCRSNTIIRYSEDDIWQMTHVHRNMPLANVKLNSLCYIILTGFRRQDLNRHVFRLSVPSNWPKEHVALENCYFPSLYMSFSKEWKLPTSSILNTASIPSLSIFLVKGWCIFFHTREHYLWGHRATNDQGMSILRKKYKEQYSHLHLCFLLSVTTCQAAAVDKPFHLKDTWTLLYL